MSKQKEITDPDEWLETAQFELQLFGFAAVKQYAILAKKQAGEIDCPLCGSQLTFVVAELNGHCAVKCSRDGCIKAME